MNTRISIISKKISLISTFLFLLLSVVGVPSANAQIGFHATNDPVDPSDTARPKPSKNCNDASGKTDVFTPPAPFLYKPFSSQSTLGSLWSAQMDHSSPIYARDGISSTLGEKLAHTDHHPAYQNDPEDPLLGGTEVYDSNTGAKIHYEYTTPLSEIPGTIRAYESPSFDAFFYYDGHDGNDFAVGGDALAAAAGKVVFAGDHGDTFGRVVEIYHSQGYITRYAHLASISVNLGDVIETPGQKIGVIGGSAHASGTLQDNYWHVHLHFSLYRWDNVTNNWDIVDPFGWDPWQDVAGQVKDPLKNCNGEISYNLWYGSWPQNYNGSGGTFSWPLDSRYVGGWFEDENGSSSGFPENDQASFITDINYPDGSVLVPNQVIAKKWRLKNIGMTTWNSNYKLAFINGEQLGAPTLTSVPSTAPNQTADISVDITAPSAGGIHTGYFQLMNPQGTYFGPKIWVKINVAGQSNKISIFTADPASPANTTKVRFHIRVDGINNFRAMRIMIDGTNVHEEATTDYYWDWNTSGYSSAEHSIVVQAADTTDTSWSHPETKSMTYTLQGSSTPTNHKPNPPTLTSPYNWYVYYSGSTATLCAQANGDPDGDGISAYNFEIHDSAQNWSSGWTGSSCVTTSSLAAYSYQWHVQVRDSRGAVSDWSQDFHFTIVSQNLTIKTFDISPLDGNSENVRLSGCVEGLGGVGITIRFLINSATDGSTNGVWTNKGELGVACFSGSDAPVWHTLDNNSLWGDGTHVVRMEAHSPTSNWSGATYQEKTIALPHRRPSNSELMAPVPASKAPRESIYLNSRVVTFNWYPSDRATSYRLSVATTPSPKDASSPVFRQTYAAGTTQATVNFSQDYPTLYWQIEAINDIGVNASGDQLIGIDRVAPTCTVQPLSSPSYDNNYQVHWAGSDAVAGVGSYDIQYLDSRSTQWSDWQNSVPSSKTYDLFIGQAGHSYSFRCRSTDNAGNIGTYPSSGDTSMLIDPTSRPPEPWWTPGYTSKRNITLQNNMASSVLPANYPINIKLTSGTTPSAAEIYNLSQTATKCNDLRVVYNNTTELNRYIKKCAVDEIDIWFRTQAPIGASATTSNYQLYIGNSSAGSPPGDASQIWYPYRESDTTNLYIFQEGSGSTAYDLSGNNRNCSLDASVGWSLGKWGAGLHFNRSNNGAARSLSCGNYYPLTSFTAEFWFKPDQANLDMFDGSLAGQMGPSGQLMWLLSIESKHLKFERWCNGGSQQAYGNIYLRQAPYINQWNYIAVTFDGGSHVNFYVNGVLDQAVTLGNSCNQYFNIPLEIGSVGGGGQGLYSIGAFRLSNTVKTDFTPGFFSSITNEPSAAVGMAITPPSTGKADLVILSMKAYRTHDGGVMVEAQVQNQGTVSTGNGFYTDLYVNHIPTGVGDYAGTMQFWVDDPIAAGSTVTLTSVINYLQTAGAYNADATAPLTETSATLYAQTDSTGVINEPNNSNNIFSEGVQVCIASPDAYEPDDTAGTASSIALDQVQRHNFDRMDSEDWIKFTAQAGQIYTLTTANLGDSSDTYMYLYGTNGTTLLTSNDDYEDTLASQIVWQAPANGTYYVLIKDWNPRMCGCGTAYDFSVSKKGDLLTVSKTGNGTGVVSSDPAGINCGSNCSSAFAYNSVVTLTALPDPSSTFTGWSGAGCSGTDTCTVILSSNQSLTASFTLLSTRTLTVSKSGTGNGAVTSSPAGINCGTTCSYAFTANTLVTLTAVPSLPSTFTGWNGEGCTGTGTCSVTLDAARSVTATFTGPAVWTRLQSMPMGRGYGGATDLNGKLYVVGGTNWTTYPNLLTAVVSYDPGTNTWATLAPFPGPTLNSTWLAATGGMLYALGGSDATHTNPMFKYNPQSNTWSTLSNSPNHRMGMSVAVASGKIYFFGGSDPSASNVITSTVQVYDTTQDTWSSGTPMPTSRGGSGAAAWNNKIYVIGGQPSVGVALTTVEAYTPATGTWQTLASMPTGRFDLIGNTKAYNGKIYVIGGCIATPTCSMVATAEVYDIGSNTWGTLPPLTDAKCALGTAIIDGNLYAEGGYNYSVFSDKLDVLNVSSVTFSISGRVIDKSGQGIAEVNISDGAGHITSTDGLGYYVLNGLPSDADTITPSKVGYKFVPDHRSYSTLLSDLLDQNFSEARFIFLPLIFR